MLQKYTKYMKNYATIFIKIFLLKNNLTIKSLALMLRQTIMPTMTEPTLNRKINHNTLKLNEFMNILDLLGYELEIKKK